METRSAKPLLPGFVEKLLDDKLTVVIIGKRRRVLYLYSSYQGEKRTPAATFPEGHVFYMRG
jgi:hypothetical protein